ncbi:TonB-dependent siderophore receptor [Thauera linaloolentis]|uniref:TonB-dependent siderophore receptor n=1 Tax=Thauera linaloolentis (strain DSM 12138 / JCM 21573 / CCUG 41526 / CIP 105981 / IAM 15112 / NBRC 102519 / 47Lol) TaxID=1123367 RepID=N6YG64_THAL4|nr:TonB-dependent receptor [Thauera linaloolentis]ENO90495.1 TonB-dependent siderophore receptor [Thauera linaloolentis 47Lol = DSM 12138]MCM8566354.1 TonB-dependent receptor [Thauera linaloolentis]
MLAVQLATAALAISAMTPDAALAADTAAAAEAAGTPRSYRIPPGPLTDALGRFAAEAGVALSFDPAWTASLQSRGLQGSHSAETGFATLLRGTDLAAERQPGGGFVLRRISTVTGQESALAAVTVTAARDGATEGTGSYAQTGPSSSATKLGLTLRETPQSISVVTRQKMDDFGLNSINQVIEHTPGLTIHTLDSERPDYSVRGFSANFQYDGISVPYNSAYAAGNTLSDMAIYDRVEVVKGSTGLVNGSGEPGATINLIRKRPTRDFQGHAALSVGRWNNYRGELDVSGPLNEAGSLRGRAVAAYQDTESHLDHHRRKVPVFYGVLEADLTPSTLLTVGADYQDTDPRGSTWSGIQIFDSNGDFNDRPRSFNPATRWSRWIQETRSAFVKLEHQFDNEWSARLHLNHQINSQEAHLGTYSFGNPNPADGSGANFLDESHVGKTRSNAADIYASGPFQLLGRRHELVLGASINKRRWSDTGSYDPAGYTNLPNYYDWDGDVPELTQRVPYDYRQETTRDNGLYTTARWNLRDDLKLITGLRVSNYSRSGDTTMRERGVTTPYLGVVYDINDTFSAYASYTDIFKPQSVQDEQGKTLDPLVGKNYEAGLKGEFFGGRLNASAAIFRLKQDNYAQLSGGLTPSGGRAYRAIDGVVTKGYELELSGELTPQWRLQGGFTHRVSRRHDEKVGTTSPEDQFSFFASYQPSGVLNRLTVGGGARWQAKTWDNVRNPVQGTVKHTMPAYWLFDAMASYRVNDKVTASLNIRNLFDKKYYTLFPAYNTYMWGAPRSYSVSLRYDF